MIPILGRQLATMSDKYTENIPRIPGEVQRHRDPIHYSSILIVNTFIITGSMNSSRSSLSKIMLLRNLD